VATQTTNLGLTKPSDSDAPDISVINNNMDLIDEEFESMVDTEDYDQTASTEAEISPVILAKINAVSEQVTSNYNLLNTNKAESTDVYTKSEVNNLVASGGSSVLPINDNYIFCGSVDYNYQGGGSGYILQNDMMIRLSNKGYNAYTKGTYYFPVHISEGSLFYYLTIDNVSISIDFNVSGITSNVFIKLEIDENDNNTMYVIGMTDTGAKYLKGSGSSGGGTFNITTVDVDTLTDYEPVNGFEECYLRDSSGAGSTANISYGTDDLVAGESELADGALYFVYVE
jgi:hypothetical protein